MYMYIYYVYIHINMYTYIHRYVNHGFVIYWNLNAFIIKNGGSCGWLEMESLSIASEPSASHSVSLDCQLYLGLAKEPDALMAFHHIVINCSPKNKKVKMQN